MHSAYENLTALTKVRVGWTSVLPATLAGLVILSCSPSSPSDPGQTQGQIQVNVSTSGTGMPSSFSVSLNGGSPSSVPPDGSVTFGSLNAGNYQVELAVPGNCTISGSAERTVGVQEGSTSTVAYSVSCSAVPTGAIGVMTSTTGSPADPDGYTVSLDAAAGQSIGVNDNLLVPDLGLGDHEVELSGVADNCLVQGANPRIVSVSESQTTQTEFEIVCSATTGRIDVTVMTTGAGLDADGYTVDLDGGTVTRPVDTNGSVEFTGVEQGDHTVALVDVPANCTVTGDNPVELEVVAGETTAVSFAVECEATTGSLEVTATTTGNEPDPNGYGVSVDGSLEQTIGINGTVTFSDLPPGDHEVELTGVAGNCSVAGENPRNVEVTAGATASTGFAVACSSTVGSIEVAVTTTGDAIDADGYSVVLDGGASTQLVDANDTVVFGGLAPGDHTLDLENVAGNCTVTSANPATAEVTAGEQADVAFTVVCQELTGSVQVNMSTTGDDLDPNGYTLRLDGGSGLAVGINGTRTFSDVVIGEHEVQVDGIASNCAAQGSNPRDVTVDEDETAQVNIVVVCSATAGQIQVSVTTTGDDLDPNGYTVDLDGTSSEAVATNGSTTFTGVSAGSHTLTLENLAMNCSATSANPTSTNVTAGATANVSFTVECTRTTGDIRVTTSSSGFPLDPTGYDVTVSGAGSRGIGNNDEELFENLEPGGYTVELQDVAVNCAVSGSTIRNVDVEADDETPVAYTITCSPLVGDLRVNVSTTGADLDPDGYEARLDGDPDTDQAVGINASTTFSSISTGSHSVTLVDVANNCTIVGADSKSAIVGFGTTVDLDFDVTCEQQTGSVQVNVTTGGVEQDTEYTATLSGGQGSQPVPATGSATFDAVPTGGYTVTLSDVADNCTDDDGDDVEPVTVTADAISPVSFSYTCEATTGSITVTTTTTGTPDPDGYLVSIEGGGGQFVDDLTPYTLGGLSATSHQVLLSGLDGTCAVVAPPNPAEPTVIAGQTAFVDFSVDCS